MKIILSAKLPFGYTREVAPEGNVVYVNENTGEFSTHHPQHIFFRKTFAKIIKGEINSKDVKEIARNISNAPSILKLPMSAQVVVDKPSEESIYR